MNSGSCSHNVVIMKMAICVTHHLNRPVQGYKFSSSLYFHLLAFFVLLLCYATRSFPQTPCLRLTFVETLNISLNFETLYFFSFTKGHCFV